jgi:hypothetical protein
MKRSTFQQHKEAMMCEKGMTIVKTRSTLLVPQSTKQTSPPKTHNNTIKIHKYYTNYGMTNHNMETCKKKELITMAITEAA